jgi:dynein heavy chain
MYGGRVIDDFDRRVVNTYMDEYMGDFIFDTFQPFHFYMNDEVCCHYLHYSICEF